MKFIGIDGCKAGWFYVGLDEGRHWQSGIISDISEISVFLSEVDLVLIDIPIGLIDKDDRERRCDIEARLCLKPLRSSSVFPVPSRSALQATDYRQASEINFNHTGRMLSKQTWNIMPKIREVDDFLNRCSQERKIREMHPEICFWALNNNRPMQHNKKTREGFQQRLQLLTTYYPSAGDIVQRAMQDYSATEVVRYDILDAIAGAVTASCYPQCSSLPANPPSDDQGLPMEVVYAKPMLEDGAVEDTALVKTPAGMLKLYAQGQAMSSCEWVASDCIEKQPESACLKAIVWQLQHYCSDPGYVFSFPKQQQGTAFSNRVWQEMCKIPAGQTLTYGELAKILNSSARAVGNACRNNPYPLFVPCHRVISASGIGGYDGQTAGEKLTIKQQLLAHEAKSEG